MKTKLVNIFKFLPILMMAFAFSSCEEVEIDIELDDTIENITHSSTSYLTSRVWVDEWTSDGVYYRQELCFYTNHTGSDYLYSEDKWGEVVEESYRFTWDWRNSRCTEIRMKYGPGDKSYMERIVMGRNKLECLLDGQYVCFRGE